MERSFLMSNLEKAKEIVKKNYRCAQCGMYNTRNVVGDAMTNIYDENGLIVDICYGYMYFEVFGLSDNEFVELLKYYNSLRGGKF
jgi:hypothetical protein